MRFLGNALYFTDDWSFLFLSGVRLAPILTRGYSGMGTTASAEIAGKTNKGGAILNVPGKL